jgi:hypothetical protein
MPAPISTQERTTTITSDLQLCQGSKSTGDFHQAEKPVRAQCFGEGKGNDLTVSVTITIIVIVIPRKRQDPHFQSAQDLIGDMNRFGTVDHDVPSEFLLGYERDEELRATDLSFCRETEINPELMIDEVTLSDSE